MDTAFQRRLRFVVQFPFPDAASRERIWRRVFPAAAPTEALDFARLAQLNVTGGVIRNIALLAAFLAADEECRHRHAPRSGGRAHGIRQAREAPRRGRNARVGMNSRAHLHLHIDRIVVEGCRPTASRRFVRALEKQSDEMASQRAARSIRGRRHRGRIASLDAGLSAHRGNA